MRNKKEKKKIDWVITIIPMIIITIICVLLFFVPEQSNIIINQIRYLLSDTLGVYYLIIGLSIFLLSLYVAGSKYGNIVLGGQNERPKYSFLVWGSMMFTAGLAADILFYSFSEWILYATDPYIKTIGNIYEWSCTYSLFHWSFIPWGLYLMLAVAFGYMLHVKKRERQKFSEACRPILGEKADGFCGRIIDLLAVFALIAGTATTFGLATPLMTSIIKKILCTNINYTVVTISILIITCMVYTYSLLKGFYGISKLANICIYMFFFLLTYVFLCGGETRFIVENSFAAFGKLVQNFFELATFVDPERATSFPQNWTIFYWAYWMVWCVATPFFIGNISRGRTIRQTIVGGYIFGVGSTILSFGILGNYSLAKQMSGEIDLVEMYYKSGDLYDIIVKVIETLPCATMVFILVLLIMILFYATSFDSIALIASCYSYHKLEENETPHNIIKLMWCVLLILLPIALVFSESSMRNLQSVSIIAAFPIGSVIVLIIISFLKDAAEFLAKQEES